MMPLPFQANSCSPTLGTSKSKQFDALYNLMGQRNPTDDQVTDFFEKVTYPIYNTYAKQLSRLAFYRVRCLYQLWVTLFNSLGGKCEGYEKQRVTPYMHAMVYHLLRFMAKHGGVKKFTGQGQR
jgi:hypothetical protein